MPPLAKTLALAGTVLALGMASAATLPQYDPQVRQVRDRIIDSRDIVVEEFACDQKGACTNRVRHIVEYAYTSDEVPDRWPNEVGRTERSVKVLRPEKNAPKGKQVITEVFFNEAKWTQVDGEWRILKKGRADKLSYYRARGLAYSFATVARATTDVFASTQNWNVPANVTSISAVVVGGGGGGGQSTSGEAGGGGGDLRTITGLAVTPGEQLNLTVGAGGTGGTQGQVARRGSASRIVRNSDSSTLLEAKGGTGANAVAGEGTSSTISGNVGGGNGGAAGGAGGTVGAGGGGGAGGYSGNGGNGGEPNSSSSNTAGAGGGGGGGGSSESSGSAAAGGGVGLLGAGTSGAACSGFYCAGLGGSGGSDGGGGVAGGDANAAGGQYGGGGGGSDRASGAGAGAAGGIAITYTVSAGGATQILLDL